MHWKKNIDPIKNIYIILGTSQFLCPIKFAYFLLTIWWSWKGQNQRRALMCDFVFFFKYNYCILLTQSKLRYNCDKDHIKPGQQGNLFVLLISIHRYKGLIATLVRASWLISVSLHRNSEVCLYSWVMRSLMAIALRSGSRGANSHLAVGLTQPSRGGLRRHRSRLLRVQVCGGCDMRRHAGCWVRVVADAPHWLGGGWGCLRHRRGRGRPRGCVCNVHIGQARLVLSHFVHRLPEARLA